MADRPQQTGCRREAHHSGPFLGDQNMCSRDFILRLRPCRRPPWLLAACCDHPGSRSHAKWVEIEVVLGPHSCSQMAATSHDPDHPVAGNPGGSGHTLLQVAATSKLQPARMHDARMQVARLQGCMDTGCRNQTNASQPVAHKGPADIVFRAPEVGGQH